MLLTQQCIFFPEVESIIYEVEEGNTNYFHCFMNILYTIIIIIIIFIITTNFCYFLVVQSSINYTTQLKVDEFRFSFNITQFFSVTSKMYIKDI